MAVRPQSRRRIFSIPDRDWARLQEIAAADGENVSTILRRLAREFIREHDREVRKENVAEQELLIIKEQREQRTKDARARARARKAKG